MATEGYLALKRVIEALQEGNHRRLAAARQAHKGSQAAWLQVQVQPLQCHNVWPGGVPEAHTLEADLQAPSTKPCIHITQLLVGDGSVG